MKTTTADKVVESLDEMFSRHGLPLSIASDNGHQFVSKIFTEYWESNGIKHRRITPLRPQANGEIERQNRATPHTTTGVSPAELLFKRKVRTKLPDVQEGVRDDEFKDKDSEMKMKAKLYADKRRNAEESELVPGDAVLMRQSKENKLSTRFEPEPYKVVSRDKNSVVVESPQGVQYQRNLTHVKKYQTPAIDCEDSTQPSDYGEQPTEIQNKVETAEQPTTASRPTRTRKVPKKFDDFVVT
ncbi:Uncharacterized protein K02A2.6 [Exaiptasia diaphana]|nr:Uncharacterized protein K02A2.6 [Exaiptasia diaphana]